jgi:hypothetical protein
VQLTDAPAVNGGSINLSRKEMKLYYIRGGNVGRTDSLAEDRMKRPRQIVELDVGALLKNAMGNEVKAPETYERTVITLPEDLQGSGLALDADETPDEWVTYETVSGPDEVMFNIMGHLPYLRKKPTGIAVVHLRTGQMKLLGQVEEEMGEGRQGGF